MIVIVKPFTNRKSGLGFGEGSGAAAGDDAPANDAWALELRRGHLRVLAMLTEPGTSPYAAAEARRLCGGRRSVGRRAGGRRPWRLPGWPIRGRRRRGCRRDD